MESQSLLQKCLNMFLFLLYGLVYSFANAFSLVMPMLAILVGSEAVFLLVGGEIRAAGVCSATSLGMAVLGFAAGALYRRLDGGSTAWTCSKLSAIGLSAIAFAGIIAAAPFFVDQELTPGALIACLAGSGTALLAFWGINKLCRRLHGESLPMVWKSGLQDLKKLFKKERSGS